MRKSMRTKSDFPYRRLIAFVTRAESVGPPPYGRTSFEFDGIDVTVSEDDLERTISSPDVLKPFASVRAVTTRSRFRQKFGFLPEEGDWVELRIRPRLWRGETIAFHAQLTPAGYVEHSRGVLEKARLLFARDEVPKAPQPMGASVTSILSKAAKVAALCAFPSAAIGPVYRARAILRRLSTVQNILVRDVGQANFVTFVDAHGSAAAHFDAGWPISYNSHTAPPNLSLMVKAAPVILSHWDWDHLHGYYRFPALQAVRWLTPVQTVGPGASKIAIQLHSKGLLIGYSGPVELIVRNVTMLRCTGPARLNDTGLAISVTLSSQKKALLVGDAGYDALGSWPGGKFFDFLVVTHHGAKFTGMVPASATGGGRGIISVGYKNVYKHPRATSMRTHRSAGWALERTSKAGTNARGDRVLS